MKAVTSYVWDAENRLTTQEPTATAAARGVPRQKLVYGYDWQGRRVSKIVFNYVAGSWQLAGDYRFLYDGWNLMAIWDGTTGAVVATFLWGLDLSGTREGAGGIGGLLAMTVHSGTNAGTYFYAYDGNGNVVGLVNAATGQWAAQYEYGPFGEPIRATGPVAFVNPFRFSTKYCDDETSHYYYGYRYYSPTQGRWLSRDPVEERYDLNLYCYNYNAPNIFIDPNGLWGIQFGSFQIGWGNPNLVFNKESWMDLANGAAATLDGLIPFGDPLEDLYQNGNIWSDEYEPLSEYESSLYENSKLGGEIAQFCLTSAFPLRPFAALKQPITHWGGPLRPGSWVMTGGPTVRNWIMAGAKWNPSKYTTATVPKSSLNWPSGWQWFKGLFGQRIYNP